MDYSSEMDYPQGCSHMFENGDGCKARPVKGTDRCIAHSNTEVRDRAAQKMKDSKHKINDFESIMSVSKWDLKAISRAMRSLILDVTRGKISPAMAHACSALANVAIRSLVQGDLETRLEKIENEVHRRNRLGDN